MTSKLSYWVSGLLVAGMLAVAGCGNSNDAGGRAMPQAIDPLPPLATGTGA